MKKSPSSEFEFVNGQDKKEFEEIPKGEQDIAMKIFAKENKESGEASSHTESIKQLSVAESKEALNLPPILFIYRDNDLYESSIPGIINSLQTTGRKVEAQVFPRGTSDEKISKWLKEHSVKFGNKEIVEDDTVEHVDHEIFLELFHDSKTPKKLLDTYKERDQNVISLDSIFQNVADSYLTAKVLKFDVEKIKDDNRRRLIEEKEKEIKAHEF